MINARALLAYLTVGSLQSSRLLTFIAVVNTCEFCLSRSNHVVWRAGHRDDLLQVIDCFGIVLHGRMSERPVEQCTRPDNYVGRLGANNHIVERDCLLRTICRGVFHALLKKVVVTTRRSEQVCQAAQDAHSKIPNSPFGSDIHQIVEPLMGLNGSPGIVKTTKILLGCTTPAPVAHVAGSILVGPSGRTTGQSPTLPALRHDVANEGRPACA
jgi:hypothetical protein